MNLIDIFKNPLPLIAASAVVFLAVFILSDKLADKKPRKHPKFAAVVERLTPYSRKAVFAVALSWAIVVYAHAAYAFNEVDPAVTYMARMFGLSALSGLFLVLTLGVLRVYFPQLSINKLLLHASRGLGLSTFFFVCLHVMSAFYANLDGKLNAVLFLSGRHQIALLLSTTSFAILFLMAITSIDRVIDWMTFARWKKLHRFVHVAIILVLFHAFLIGSHFAVVAAPLPLIIIWLALSFLFLEAGAIYKKLQVSPLAANHQRIKWRYAALILLVCAGMLTTTLALKSTYNPHAGHSMVYNTSYAINVTATPSTFNAGQPVQLSVRVIDKATSQPWTAYSVVNEKLMHLIVVSEDMQHYEHLHPDYTGNGVFTVQFTPPLESTYYLYAEFAPSAATEALATAKLQTQQAPAVGAVPKLTEDLSEQRSGQYSVRLSSSGPFRANQNYQLSFNVFDDTSGKAVSTFEPYLGVAGHLAIIHENKQTYLHVHPTGSATTNGKGSIDFNAQFSQPGMYRMYLQFKVGGQLQTAAFTVAVQ